MNKKIIFQFTIIFLFYFSLITSVVKNTYASNSDAACGVVTGPGTCSFYQDAGGVAQCIPSCNPGNVSGTVTCSSCHNSINCTALPLCASAGGTCTTSFCGQTQLISGYCNNAYCCKPPPPPRPPTPTHIPTHTPSTPPSPSVCPVPPQVINITVTCPYCGGSTTPEPSINVSHYPSPSITQTVNDTPSVTQPVSASPTPHVTSGVSPTSTPITTTACIRERGTCTLSSSCVGEKVSGICGLGGLICCVPRGGPPPHN